MHPIRTLEDLVHAVTNSLGLISSHAQYLLGKADVASGKDELAVIYEEAERAAVLLSVLPENLRHTPLPTAAGVSPKAWARRERAQRGRDHGKGQQ